MLYFDNTIGNTDYEYYSDKTKSIVLQAYDTWRTAEDIKQNGIVVTDELATAQEIGAILTNTPEISSAKNEGKNIPSDSMFWKLQCPYAVSSSYGKDQRLTGDSFSLNCGSFNSLYNTTFLSTKGNESVDTSYLPPQGLSGISNNSEIILDITVTPGLPFMFFYGYQLQPSPNKRRGYTYLITLSNPDYDEALYNPVIDYPKMDEESMEDFVSKVTPYIAPPVIYALLILNKPIYEYTGQTILYSDLDDREDKAYFYLHYEYDSQDTFYTTALISASLHHLLWESSTNEAPSQVRLLDILDSGFVSLFYATKDQLKSLSQELWDQSFWDVIKNKFTGNPQDVILSVSILPCDVPHAPSPRPVKAAWVSLKTQLYPVTEQFITIDCGTVTVPAYHDNYTDFEPYSRAQIVLPFIGSSPIDLARIQGQQIGLQYVVDCYTGACTAQMSVNGTLCYQWNGATIYNIPITAANYTQQAQTLMRAVSTVGLAVATLGTGAALTAGAGIAENVGETAVTKLLTSTGASAAATINSAANSAPRVQASGNSSGNIGYTASRVPFIIIDRPVYANIPDSYKEYEGLPHLNKERLGDLTGFVKVASCNLENIPCTAEEIRQIENLLKQGVII